MDCHFLLQRIFLTQGSNLDLLHCKQNLYLLSYEGSYTNNSHENDNLFVCDTLPFLMFSNLTLSPWQPQEAGRGIPVISVILGKSLSLERASVCSPVKWG